MHRGLGGGAVNHGGRWHLKAAAQIATGFSITAIAGRKKITYVSKVLNSFSDVKSARARFPVLE